MGVCWRRHEGGGEVGAEVFASQVSMLCELTCNYRLKASIVSQSLVGITSEPVSNDRDGEDSNK